MLSPRAQLGREGPCSPAMSWTAGSRLVISDFLSNFGSRSRRALQPPSRSGCLGDDQGGHRPCWRLPQLKRQAVLPPVHLAQGSRMSLWSRSAGWLGSSFVRLGLN